MEKGSIILSAWCPFIFKKKFPFKYDSCLLMKIKALPRHVCSIKLTRFKAPPVASPTSQCPTGSFTSILYNCILNENALREQIIEWHMNLIIFAESLEGIGSDKLFISQVSKENLSLNLTLDSKREGHYNGDDQSSSF